MTLEPDGLLIHDAQNDDSPSTTTYLPEVASVTLEEDHQESLKLIEWPQLLAAVVKRCPSPYGHASWLQHPFLPDEATMQSTQHQVDALRLLIVRFGDAPQGQALYLKDSTPSLQALAKGGLVGLSDLFSVYQTLRHAHGLISHAVRHLPEIKVQQPEGGNALAWLDAIPSSKDWWQLLEAHFTPEGDIKETASPQLAQLRRRARSQNDEIQRTLQDMLTSSTVQQALQDRVIVQRNGRYTLPVNVFYKTTVPGIVHDTSSSGSTVFIEPRRVVELSNRLKETELEAEKEITRIIKVLSEALQPHASELLRYIQGLTKLERLWAAALLAREIKGQPLRLKPRANHPPALELKQLKHPLLCLQTGTQDVIGSDVLLGDALTPAARCMIITGPNTGGKTVMLKSVGLANLMLQAGLLPVVAEGSSATIFPIVLADIGDSQSIQSNLSTFSGQMTRLARFAHPSTSLEGALILLDEIAAGTDPLEGSALARALLHCFYEKGASTIVTTHLGVLKQEAYSREGYINASVSFDAEALIPTYQLFIGIPGASNAITIARRLGLNEAVLEEAETLMGSSAVEAATLLTTLEQEKLNTHHASEQSILLKQELEQRVQQLKEEQQAFREKKKQLLQDYQHQFRARLRQFEEQAKRLKKELKQAETQPEALRFARHRISRLEEKTEAAFTQELAPIEAELQAEAPQKPVYTFNVGDVVKHPKLNGRIEVVALSADGKKATIKSGSISLVVPHKELEPVGLSDSAMKALKKSERREILKRLQQSTVVREPANLPKGRMLYECDVRGKRASDAIEEVQAFIDNAHMVGMGTVGIIHGLGTGALKKAVRDFLKTNPFVKDFYPEQAHLGGDGKTIVEMR
jgi:DNA mismatch repair protein MutS2